MGRVEKSQTILDSLCDHLVLPKSHIFGVNLAWMVLLGGRGLGLVTSVVRELVTKLITT